MSKPGDLRNTPKIPFEILNEMNAGWEDALGALSVLMTDEMLQFIAAADYGYEQEKCYKLLKEIIREQKPPQERDFDLFECLELTRWLTPSNDVEHKCRAFSCTLLLMFTHTSNYEPISDENETIVSLIDSVAALKVGQKEMQALLTWKILADYKLELDGYLEDEEDKEYIDEITIDPFFIYGLLLLMLLNDEDDKAINQVLKWSIDMEKDVKNIPPFANEYRAKNITKEEKEAPYLLRTTNFNQRHELWQSLSKNVLKLISENSVELNYSDLRKVLTAVGNNEPMRF